MLQRLRPNKYFARRDMADYLIPWRRPTESPQGHKLRCSLVHTKGSKIVSAHDGVLPLDEEGTELGLENLKDS